MPRHSSSASTVKAPSIQPAPQFRRIILSLPGAQEGQEERGDHHPETNVVVPVVGIVPVAVGTADVPAIVIEGAAPQHAVVVLGISPQSGIVPQVALMGYLLPPAQ